MILGWIRPLPNDFRSEGAFSAASLQISLLFYGLGEYSDGKFSLFAGIKG